MILIHSPLCHGLEECCLAHALFADDKQYLATQIGCRSIKEFIEFFEIAPAANKHPFRAHFQAQHPFFSSLDPKLLHLPNFIAGTLYPVNTQTLLIRLKTGGWIFIWLPIIFNINGVKIGGSYHKFLGLTRIRGF